MRTLVLLAVISAIALVSRAISGPDSTATLTASMPWHLMLFSGLYGIAVLGSRFAQAGPVRIAPRAPNPPRRMALTRTAAAIGVGIIVLAPWSAAALTITSLVISEVMVNPSGADDQREWVELYNGTGAAIDLIGYSLGWGGADYTDGGTLPLSGMIASGATFVIGGPLSDAGNGNPTYDLPIDFDGNLQNGGFFADGVALFDVGVGLIPVTDPIAAVIYGLFNFNGLIDETGLPGPVDYFGFAAGGTSIEITDGGWVSPPVPTPGTPPAALTPQPGTAITLGMGLAILATGRRHARLVPRPRCATTC